MNIWTWTILYILIGVLIANAFRKVDGEKSPPGWLIFLAAMWAPLLVLFNVISLSKLSEKLQKLKKESEDDGTTE